MYLTIYHFLSYNHIRQVLCLFNIICPHLKQLIDQQHMIHHKYYIMVKFIFNLFLYFYFFIFQSIHFQRHHHYYHFHHNKIDNLSLQKECQNLSYLAIDFRPNLTSNVYLSILLRIKNMIRPTIRSLNRKKDELDNSLGQLNKFA